MQLGQGKKLCLPKPEKEKRVGRSITFLFLICIFLPKDTFREENTIEMQMYGFFITITMCN